MTHLVIKGTFHSYHLRPSENTDIEIIIYKYQKNSYEVRMNIILWLGGVGGPSVYVLLSLVNKGNAFGLYQSCRGTELGREN